MSQIFEVYHPITTAKEIFTTEIIPTEQDTDYELISVEKLRSPESIRTAFLRSNIEPLEKAMEKGASYVRDYFNSANMRKRRALEKWVIEKWFVQSVGIK